MQHNGDCVNWYLNGIGRIPLLTAEQELILGKAIAEWLALGEVSSPTAQQKRTIRAGKRAYDKMFKSNLRLVVALAKKYQHRTQTLDLSDLLQEGNIGLATACRKFDHSRGYKFSTYAYWWIRQAITRAIAMSDTTIRLPTHVAEKISKLRTFTYRHLQEHGEPPSHQQLLDHIGFSAEELSYTLNMARGCASLNQRATEDGSELIDLQGIEEPIEDQVARVERSRLIYELPKILPKLDERQAEVIQMRFFHQSKTKLRAGMPADGLTFAQIGKKLGVSRERARQLQKIGLSKLKPHLEPWRELVS